ncbi:MAG: hypothetical protein ABS987_11430, partial [Ruminococcus sp.]
IATSIQSLCGQALGTSASSTDVLYRATLPKGAVTLAMKNNQSGYITAALDERNRLKGQATLTPVEVTNGSFSDNHAVASSTSLCMIAIAAMLMTVTAKLDEIKQEQDNLMAFLEQKEKAVLEGNLRFLSDILNNYKLNWNNKKYIAANHIKVLDIKQASEQSIMLFKSQVHSVIKEGALFHTTKKINKSVNDLLARFDDYRLAVYMYAFSSYVDVLLLENFESSFLQKIAEKIKNYALEYREIYSDVYTSLERYTKRSVRSIVSRSTAGVVKTLGNTINRIPKLGDTQIDENLLAASERLNEFDTLTNQKVSRMIVNCQRVDVSPFLDRLHQIDHLCNSPLTILISGDNLYIEAKQ